MCHPEGPETWQISRRRGGDDAGGQAGDDAGGQAGDDAGGQAVVGVLGRGLVEPGGPVLRADDLGVLRGEGVFESVLLVEGRPVALDDHLSRLSRSARALDLPEPTADTDDAWRALVSAVSAVWPHEIEGTLRLVRTRGNPSTGVPPQGFALATPVPPETLRQRWQGLRAITLTYPMPATARAHIPWLLAGVKSTSYAMNMAALREARRRGADDAVFVSLDGEVLEGATSSVAWVDRAGALCTSPADELGILSGTTTRTVIDLAEGLGLPTRVCRADIADLRQATEAMLLSSVRTIAPLRQLDGVPVGDGAIGPVTRQLVAAHERWLRSGPETGSTGG